MFDRLKRGFEEIIPEEEFKQRVSDPIRVKFGADPTGADLHLGHAVILNKLRQFQDAGHTVVFIIGDYTARIGDPSGQDETRPSLDPGEVEKNAETYTEQVFEILDRDRTEVRYNSRWLEDLGTDGVLELASKLTVARMLERDDFSARYEAGNPIRIHEFLYPLLQGWDSVEVGADLELGGTDQKFNLLVGRRLQKQRKQQPQMIGTLPILPGTDGTKKMSKSYGNHIPLASSARDMFGGVMSIPDPLILPYARLLTDLDQNRIDEMEVELNHGENPKSLKKELATTITSRYKGKEAAREGRGFFERTVEEGEQPDERQLEEHSVSEPEIWIVDLLDESGLVESRSEAKRLLNQGGVYVDGERLEGLDHDLSVTEPFVLRVGKRRYRRIIPS